jgi:hypothetical protein
MVDAISSSASFATGLAGASLKRALSDAPRNERTIHDTLEIGSEGNRIINLERGAELARSLPDASDRDAFDAALESAQQDIRRITRLFGEVLLELQARPGTATGSAVIDGNDITSLSEGGGTVVNLAQTQVLIQRFESGALGDRDFVSALEKASRDVRRITTLFTETLKAAFVHDYRV